MNVEVALGSVLAGFRVERLLGSGAMGAVYLAEDVHLKRKVAVKVLSHELAEDERFRRRFLVESQLAAGLEHPHIVPIYGAGEVDDLLYLAMKYVEGYDLRELIEATERVGDERAVKLLVQIGDALDTAHGLGLVHRDVKPANILIGAGEAEHAYLCDFGLARHASTVMSLTSERGFMGTIACADIRPDVPKIACPTLVITTEESGLATVADTRAWQQQIPDSELLVLSGNSYHVAATHAAESAQAALDFIARRGN